MQNFFANRTDFSDGHLCFLFFVQGEIYFLFGVNPRGLLSSFGGRAEYGETLTSVLFREYIEETHESIVSLFELADLLRRGEWLILPRARGKFSYVGFVCLDEAFDFEAARATFHLQRAALQHRDTPYSYLEIVDLVAVRLADVILMPDSQVRFDCSDGVTRAVRGALLESLREFNKRHAAAVMRAYGIDK